MRDRVTSIMILCANFIARMSKDRDDDFILFKVRGLPERGFVIKGIVAFTSFPPSFH